MSKEKVTVVTTPGQTPRVFKRRRDGADVARERSMHRGQLYSDADRQSLGRFVEGTERLGSAGDTIVQEVELEDPQ